MYTITPEFPMVLSSSTRIEMGGEKEFQKAKNLVNYIEDEIEKFGSLPKSAVTADTLSVFMNDTSVNITKLVSMIQRDAEYWKADHIAFFLGHRILGDKYKILDIPRALIDIYTATPAKYSITLPKPTDALIAKKILASIESLMQLEKTLRYAENMHVGNILAININEQNEGKRKFTRLLSSLDGTNEFRDFSLLVSILRYHKKELIRFFAEET